MLASKVKLTENPKKRVEAKEAHIRISPRQIGEELERENIYPLMAN